MSILKNDIRSVNIALKYQNAPINIDELKTIKATVTYQCRSYLIGKYCVQETAGLGSSEQASLVLERAAAIFGFSGKSMHHYIGYSQAIDRLHNKLPRVAEDILAGKSRISLRAATPLSKMAEYDIMTIMERLATEKTLASEIFYDQKKMPVVKTGRGRSKWDKSAPPGVSIKDTPPHDPDAQIMALSLTVPSWVKSMEKTFAHTDFQSVSPTAKTKLAAELKALGYITAKMLRAAEE